jgi:hypothetical protein
MVNTEKAMKIDFRSGELCLTNNQPLRLEEARGLRVVCTAGVIWITVDGEAGDTFLHPGQSHIISCDGLALIESIGDGKIRVDQPTRFSLTTWLRRRLGETQIVVRRTSFKLS